MGGGLIYFFPNRGELLLFFVIYVFIFFSARELADFIKSYHLIGSWSGRNFLIRTATAGGIGRCVMSS